MKHLISFLILLITLFNHSKAQTDSADLLLQKLKSKTITVAERKKLKNIAYEIQNRGQLLDESKHDYSASLIFINKAITMFNSLGDTLDVANNKKFKGYLLGRFGKFTEGKAEINEAINLYQLKNADWGIAVSQFDLSRLFELDNKLDSALFYCKIALGYWKSKRDSGRIFLNQNMLINLLTKSKELTEAKLLQIESTKMAENSELHWQGLLDFYVTSEHLYKATKELKFANYFQKLYIKKILELKKEGITASSYFEEVK